MNQHQKSDNITYQAVDFYYHLWYVSFMLYTLVHELQEDWNAKIQSLGAASRHGVIVWILPPFSILLWINLEFQWVYNT